MCTKEENLHKLQLIQNCGCRIILKADNYTSIKSLHEELQLPYLSDRRKIHMAMECFTALHNDESGLHYMFKPVDAQCERETRSTRTNRVEISNVRTVTGRKAFSFRGPNFWNKLESDARTISDKPAFKTHISKVVCRDVNHPG